MRNSGPVGSMYDIFTYIWFFFMVNVSRYTIHGSYGGGFFCFKLEISSRFKHFRLPATRLSKNSENDLTQKKRRWALFAQIAISMFFGWQGRLDGGDFGKLPLRSGLCWENSSIHCVNPVTSWDLMGPRLPQCHVFPQKIAGLIKGLLRDHGGLIILYTIRPPISLQGWHWGGGWTP